VRLSNGGGRTRPAGGQTHPKHNRARSRTFTCCESARGLAPAIRPARPAALAVAWSESPGPGPRAHDLRLVLAPGPSVSHLRPD
jgi:hypothetical protein